MAVQSTYTERMDAAVAGQIANTETSNVISRTVEDSAGIAFGLAVTQGTDDHECTAFAGTGSILGIAARDQSVDPDNPSEFAEGDTARILTQGVIWVTAAEAVDAGDSVYVEDDGTFTSTANSTATQIDNARWDTSTTGSALAKVAIR